MIRAPYLRIEYHGLKSRREIENRHNSFKKKTEESAPAKTENWIQSGRN